MSGFFNSLVSPDDSCGPINPLAQLSKGLQGEGSQLGRDRFVALPGTFNPTSSGFRSHNLQPGEAAPDAAAAAFFSNQSHHTAGPLDLRLLHHALPQQPSQLSSPMPVPAWAADFMQNKVASPAPMLEGVRQQGARSDSPAWSQDFALHGPALEQTMGRHDHPMSMSGHGIHGISSPPLAMQNAYLPWQSPYQDLHQMSGPSFQTQQYHQSYMQQQPAEGSQKHSQMGTSQWEDAFLQHAHRQSPRSGLSELPSNSAEEVHESLTARPVSPTLLATANDPDLLAKTAGELLQNLSQDLASNTKMRDSSFMSLMRKLRDKEATVEGDKIVSSDASQQTTSSGPSVGLEESAWNTFSQASTSTGPQPVCVWPDQVRNAQEGTAGNAPMHTLESLTDAYEEMNAVLGDAEASPGIEAARAFVGDGARLEDEDMYEDLHTRENARTAVPGATSSWEEDFDSDTQLLRSGPLPPTMEQSLRTNAQQQEWGDLQSEWDRHQASATGLDALNTASYSNYPFHSRNPYLLSHSRQHLPTDTLLEKEADVQIYPENASAWLSLGLKQQENEREPQAIQALLRALELDSSLGEAWLGLAVSYTNDNLRGKAYSAIERWADVQHDYSEIVQDYTQKMNGLGQGPANSEGMTLFQRHAFLTGLLMEMARAGASAGAFVDPEVQIALGVLFNASEEYDKACDCFSAALSVRPEDPHLYNRLGATLANSGKSVEAMDYYYRALELQPDFARATFNLAIACINQGHHTEAAEHLLRALEKQHDSDEDVGEPLLQHINASENVESSNLLWETLATCCNNLKRADLAQVCSSKNLAPFREVFSF